MRLPQEAMPTLHNAAFESYTFRKSSAVPAAVLQQSSIPYANIVHHDMFDMEGLHDCSIHTNICHPAQQVAVVLLVWSGMAGSPQQVTKIQQLFLPWMPPMQASIVPGRDMYCYSCRF
jgi:hypothetical protein